MWWARSLDSQFLVGVTRSIGKTIGLLGKIMQCWKDARLWVLVIYVYLAKLAWHLLDKPDSLYVMLLKAKSYPHRRLLDTTFANSTSPPWQGIIYGLELLKQVIIWRVYDGKALICREITSYSGVLDSELHAKRNRTTLKWVSSLFVPGIRTWDENPVRHMY